MSIPNEIFVAAKTNVWQAKIALFRSFELGKTRAHCFMVNVSAYTFGILLRYVTGNFTTKI